MNEKVKSILRSPIAYLSIALMAIFAGISINVNAFERPSSLVSQIILYLSVFNLMILIMDCALNAFFPFNRILRFFEYFAVFTLIIYLIDLNLDL
ncbi:MAG: hypothetical protein MRY83_16565 [Flavobacteriales bacterium]|nr:hypothetical protein [Flavobacteriales bacterium]